MTLAWKRTGVAAFVLALAESALAEEQLICVGDKATGFKWTGRSWAEASFHVSKDKFLVQEIAPIEMLGATYTFKVQKFGEKVPTIHCTRHGEPKNWRLICGGLGYGMMIDSKSMRFQEVYGLGYIDGEDAPGNTPSLTIGTCVRLK